jgi:hypothetical protein
MSSDKWYSDAVRARSSDEDVASTIITGVSKKVFLQKSQTLNSETERARCTIVSCALKKIWKALELEARDYFERAIVYKEFCLS